MPMWVFLLTEHGFISLNGVITAIFIVEKSLIMQFYPNDAKAAPECR